MDEFSNTTLTKNISHVLCLFLCPVVIICLRRYNKFDLHRFKEFLVIVTQKHDQKKRKLISGKYYYLRKKRTRKYPSLFFFFLASWYLFPHRCSSFTTRIAPLDNFSIYEKCIPSTNLPMHEEMYVSPFTIVWCATKIPAHQQNF